MSEKLSLGTQQKKLGELIEQFQTLINSLRLNKNEKGRLMTEWTAVKDVLQDSLSVSMLHIAKVSIVLVAVITLTVFFCMNAASLDQCDKSCNNIDKQANRAAYGVALPGSIISGLLSTAGLIILGILIHAYRQQQ